LISAEELLTLDAAAVTVGLDNAVAAVVIERKQPL
jgi:hypothetical protein